MVNKYVSGVSLYWGTPSIPALRKHEKVDLHELVQLRLHRETLLQNASKKADIAPNSTPEKKKQKQKPNPVKTGFLKYLA